MKKDVAILLIMLLLSGCGQKGHIKNILESGMNTLNQIEAGKSKKDAEAINNLVAFSNINLWDQAVENGLQVNGYRKSTFRYAVEKGTYSFVYHIIDHGVDTAYTDEFGKNELMYLNNWIYSPIYEKIAEKLICSGCNINKVDKMGRTIFEDAIETSSVMETEVEKKKQIDFLLKHGAIIQEKDIELLHQVSFSYYAALKLFSEKTRNQFPNYECKNSIEAVLMNDENYLLDNLHNEEFSESDASTLVFWAAALSSLDIFTQILNHAEASLEILDNRGNSLLMAAAATGNADTFLYLLNRVPQNIYNLNNESILTSALAGGNRDVIDMAFKNTNNDWNYDTDQKEGFKRFTRLITALSYHDDEIFFERVLSSVNMTKYDLEKLFGTLVRNGNDPYLSVLLNHSSMNTIYSDYESCKALLGKCSTGEQIKMLAAHIPDEIKPEMPAALFTILYRQSMMIIEDSEPLIEAFYESGIDLSKENTTEPLILAATHAGDTNGVLKLIEYGADVDAPAKNDARTPLMIAAIGDVNTLQILLRNGADVNKTDSTGASALAYAVSWSAQDCVRMLLEYGADKNVTRKNGSSVFDIALEAGNQDIIDMLK